MSHIFISYSRQDQAYARHLTELLQQYGFNVWIDDRIDYGDRWWKTIVKAVESCAAFIVIMSPAAEQSEWVEREILIAQRSQKPILPLLLSGREFALLITTQFTDVRHGQMPDQRFYERLNQYIQPGSGRGRLVTPPSSTRRAPARPSTRLRKPILLTLIGIGVLSVLVAASIWAIYNATLRREAAQATTPADESTVPLSPLIIMTAQEFPVPTTVEFQSEELFSILEHPNPPNLPRISPAELGLLGSLEGEYINVPIGTFSSENLRTRAYTAFYTAEGGLTLGFRSVNGYCGAVLINEGQQASVKLSYYVYAPEDCPP